MNTSTNVDTTQTDNDTLNDIFHSIRALDIGISYHEAWLSKVHQSLICENSHPNLEDLCEDAHCRCRFGQWLYSPATEELKDLDSFQTVIEEHRQMHALARKILTKSDSRQDIDEEEYRKFSFQAVTFKLEVRNLQYELMSKVCIVDHLTGAWNRYAMYSNLNQEKERLIRAGHPCAICMMDLDYFKRVNDSHGHGIGDLVLKAVIDYCNASLRKYDSIYRYGGEEFLFCLPDAEEEEAQTVIERLCSNLGKLVIPLPSGENLSVTASFGIASLQKETSIEDTIQAADHALLCAKAKGRNRVCCWEEGLSSLE